tara:strand:- start:142 stop:486 length:345 start_codon:yes stop_codon:yes gene_type:complete
MKLIFLSNLVIVLFTTTVYANNFYCNIPEGSNDVFVYEVTRKSVNGIKIIRNKEVIKDKLTGLSGKIINNKKNELIWETKMPQKYTLDRISGILIVTQEGNTVLRGICFKGKDL